MAGFHASLLLCACTLAMHRDIYNQIEEELTYLSLRLLFAISSIAKISVLGSSE
jgi:hypothetical protein